MTESNVYGYKIHHHLGQGYCARKTGLNSQYSISVRFKVVLLLWFRPKIGVFLLSKKIKQNQKVKQS